MRPSLTGTVVSQGKMDKTVKIRIQKLKWNRIVSKYVKDYKTMLVHDELNKCREGDVVRVQYVRPLSARKSWAVAEIMKLKGTSWQKYLQVIPDQVRRDELEKVQQFVTQLEQRKEYKGVDPTVADLRSAAVSPEKVEELKAKYNLSAWPPTSEVVELSESKLEAEIESLRQKIDNNLYIDKARELLDSDPTKADMMLSEIGKNPNALKPSMKRNILAKILAKDCT